MTALGHRSKQLAGALTTLGVKAGDRIATLAWNGYRHVELYFGVSGMEAVCHTLNPRLHPSQLSYILNHAEDRFLFVDLTFVPLVEAISEHLKTVEGVVVMTDADHMPESGLSNLMCYEDLLSAEEDDFVWPEFDENTASSLCYTSGTTKSSSSSTGPRHITIARSCRGPWRVRSIGTPTRIFGAAASSWPAPSPHLG